MAYDMGPEREGLTPPTPPIPPYSNARPTPNAYARAQDTDVLTLRLREMQEVLQQNRIRLMVQRLTEAPGEAPVQDQEPQQQVEQQEDQQQQEPIRVASPRDPGLVAYHREWPEVFHLVSSKYPMMECQLSAPNYSLPQEWRFEVIWAVQYHCFYYMHYDRPLAKKEYQISFRSGPNIGLYHHIQFSSDEKISRWHGSWEYDDKMQIWSGTFRPDWPECLDLKWSQLSRDGPTTWRGRDKEGRSIEMKLYVVRYYCLPAQHWLTYDVLQSGEMVARRPYT